MGSNDIQCRQIVLAGQLVVRWKTREVNLHVRQNRTRQDEQVYELRHIKNEQQGRDESVAVVQCSHCRKARVNARSKSKIHAGNVARGDEVNEEVVKRRTSCNEDWLYKCQLKGHMEGAKLKPRCTSAMAQDSVLVNHERPLPM